MIHQGTIAGEGTEEELARRFSSGSRVEVLVRGSADALKRALAAVPKAGQPEVEETGGVVRARLTLPDEQREALSRAIVHANLGLIGLRTLSHDLEGIFVQMSQQPTTAATPTSASTGTATEGVSV